MMMALWRTHQIKNLEIGKMLCPQKHRKGPVDTGCGAWRVPALTKPNWLRWPFICDHAKIAFNDSGVTKKHTNIFGSMTTAFFNNAGTQETFVKNLAQIWDWGPSSVSSLSHLFLVRSATKRNQTALQVLP